MADNPQAFPSAPDGIQPEYGMTLRDWFAGQVLTSAAALPLGAEDYAYRSKVAYGMADAMLAERERGQ